MSVCVESTSATENLIERINEQREDFARHVRRVRDHVLRQRKALGRLREAVRAVDEVGTASIQAAVAEPRAALELLQGEFVDHLAALEKLLARFQRDILYIMVAGHSRQGKSTLLQRLTGLTSREIPSGAGGDCTSVPCIIQHVDGEPFAEVTFHSRESLFHDVILPYFEIVLPGKRPADLDEFLASPLPRLESPTALQAELWKRLRRYQEHYPQFRDCLTGARAQRITLDEVREHVAKYDDQDVVRHWKHLAVVETRIFCPFPRYGLRKLALIDVQGLGAVEVGVRDRMTRTAATKADVVIFVRKAANGDDLKAPDLDLYQAVASAVPELPLAEWSFLVFNHDRAHPTNLVDCQRLRAGWAASEFKVAHSLIADCSSPDASEQILLPVLRHLHDHQAELDRLVAARVQTAIDRSHASLVKLSTRLNELVDQAVELRSDNFVVNDRFDAIMKKLEAALRDEALVNATAAEAAIRLAVGELITSLKSRRPIPTKTEFEWEAGQNKRVLTFVQAMTKARETIVETAKCKEQIARGVFDDVRERVRQAFDTTGALAGLGLPAGKDWWSALAELIGAAPAQRKLASELIEFGQYEFSNKSRLAARVEPCLAVLEPDSSPYRPFELQVKSLDYKSLLGLRSWDVTRFVEQAPVSVDRAVELLDRAYDETVSRIERDTEAVAAEIANEIRCVVRQFLATALREEWKNAWREIYVAHQEAIWPEEFAQRSARRKTLLALRQQLEALSVLLNPADVEFAPA